MTVASAKAIKGGRGWAPPFFGLVPLRREMAEDFDHIPPQNSLQQLLKCITLNQRWQKRASATSREEIVAKKIGSVPIFYMCPE